MMIVAALRSQLPRGYFAEPRVHLGSTAEMPTLSIIANLPAQDEYEVLVYDERRHIRLVAAVEIVSPSNKDRPENRAAFIAKCLGFLRQGVSVVIIDVVTTRTQNLFGELLDLLGCSQESVSDQPLYAAACRITQREDEWRLEAWLHSLVLGRLLPTMPLWLAADLAIPLELEESYEQSCGILGIR
ncbi:MAG: DUF4058 family protein [Gemmataceae bacterium]